MPFTLCTSLDRNEPDDNALFIAAQYKFTTIRYKSGGRRASLAFGRQAVRQSSSPHIRDAADENWNIEDAVIDAQRKIGALESYRAALDAQVAGNEQAVTAEIADLKTAQDRAIVEIRKQISELEQLLEREVQKTAEQIAGMESELKARRDAAGREGARIGAEIIRLREIPAQFVQPTTNQ